MNKDLYIIKKKYGEKMMHLCRELFPTLLEKKGVLSKLLLDNFEPTRFLYEDIIKNNKIESFTDYIYNLSNLKTPQRLEINKTPQQLLNEAGYNLYECKTEEDIEKFKKYYSKGESLCTFDSTRLQRCHVFFAVKKNVNYILREKFSKPDRQDLYGTSVICIQFTKGKVNILSIKNRYNHTVENPDATFSNNLDNIIQGLTRSFEKEYQLKIDKHKKGDFELPNYILASDNKYYKYNYEINGIYYCPNNIIIDNFEVKKIDSQRYIVLDYFIIDIKDKEIILYDSNIKDSFIDGINNIKKVNIIKDKTTKNKYIEIFTPYSKIIIEIDKTNKIISYKNVEITKIGDNFLYYNKVLKNIDLSKVIEIKDNFLYSNIELERIEFLKLIKIGNNFIHKNEKIESALIPEVIHIGNYFLTWNKALSTIDFNKLLIVGDCFIMANQSLNSVKAEKLINAGTNFLNYADIEILYLPNISKQSKKIISERFVIIKDLSSKTIAKANKQSLKKQKKLQNSSSYFI